MYDRFVSAVLKPMQIKIQLFKFDAAVGIKCYFSQFALS